MIAEMARGTPAVVPAGSIERGRPAPSNDGSVFAPYLAQRFVGADDDPVAVWNRRRDVVITLQVIADLPAGMHIRRRSRVF
jgi:hypothetical protein